MVKNPPVMQETWVRSLGWEDSLEESMATHSIILAWRIPMDGGAWRVTVHGVSKSRTQLSDQVQHTYFDPDTVIGHWDESKGKDKSLPSLELAFQLVDRNSLCKLTKGHSLKSHGIALSYLIYAP